MGGGISGLVQPPAPPQRSGRRDLTSPGALSSTKKHANSIRFAGHVNALLLSTSYICDGYLNSSRSDIFPGSPPQQER